MTEPTHSEIVARVGVLNEKADLTERQIEEIREELKGLRREVRELLISTAENQGVWLGVRTGVRLTLFVVAATAGAGFIRSLEWIKEILN